MRTFGTYLQDAHPLAAVGPPSARATHAGGGQDRAAPGDSDWVAGLLFQGS